MWKSKNENDEEDIRASECYCFVTGNFIRIKAQIKYQGKSFNYIFYLQ